MVERFVGLDVSQRSTSVCILDGQGNRVWRGKCATDPAAIAEVIRLRAGGPARVGLETGPLTPWLVHELRSRGLEVVCLDARQRGRPWRCGRTRPTRTTPRAWRRSCAWAGTAACT